MSLPVNYLYTRLRIIYIMLNNSCQAYAQELLQPFMEANVELFRNKNTFQLFVCPIWLRQLMCAELRVLVPA